jgi:zinc protease
VATPKPGVPVDRLLKEIDEEVAKLSKEPPTEGELERAVNKALSATIFGLEPVGGFGGRAATLNRYYFQTGDPGYLPKDVGRYPALKREDLRDAAAKYLKPDARVVLTVMPRKRSAAASGGYGGAALLAAPPSRKLPAPRRLSSAG